MGKKRQKMERKVSKKIINYDNFGFEMILKHDGGDRINISKCKYGFIISARPNEEKQDKEEKMLDLIFGGKAVILNYEEFEDFINLCKSFLKKESFC
jgi:hypothetical protein